MFANFGIGITASLLAIAACGPTSRAGDGKGTNGNGADANPADPGGGPGDPTGQLEQCQKIDLVFVVDDSGSMSEEQTSLTTAFPKFAALLNEYRINNGQELDYRVAVTTTGRTVTTKTEFPPFPGLPPIPPQVMTEQGDNGAFRNTCEINRRWLERSDPSMADKFACRAKVGINGPSFEMPMLTTMMSLKERTADGTNAGFLRDDALLAVVMITDEDDCSRRDDNFDSADTNCGVMPQELVAFFDNLKGARNRWAAAVVAGPGPGTCMSDFGNAAEASRLKEFVTQANTGSAVPGAVFSSICDGDMAASLGQALSTFQAACDNFTVE
jgi:hypothetical protein